MILKKLNVLHVFGGFSWLRKHYSKLTRLCQTFIGTFYTHFIYSFLYNLIPYVVSSVHIKFSFRRSKTYRNGNAVCQYELGCTQQGGQFVFKRGGQSCNFGKCSQLPHLEI